MTLAPSDYIALTGLLLGTSGSVLAYLHKVRTNDIRHLDKKIDEHHEEVIHSINRLEDSMNAHLRDHAAGRFK